MQPTDTATLPQLNIETVVKDILETIDRDREKEIIARRFGLFDRKETLEQIGELLGITRERVRQLEKAVVARLRISAEKDLPHIQNVEKVLHAHLSELGNIATVKDLTDKLIVGATKIDQSRVAFLASLSNVFAVIDDDDHHYHAVGIKSIHDHAKIKELVSQVVNAISEHGKPVKAEEFDSKVSGINEHKQGHALASVSKKLASLNDHWGLIKWPTVNPKNIRDKIYLILQENTKPLHFGDIAKRIQASEFKRKDVTTQAIHNELIKDKRFVLIGRGIYALKEWGYDQGTVSDVIAKVLTEAKEPLHRDEIIKRVLKHRIVKETTILLNLQGKPQFKRVAKATYTYDPTLTK